MVLESIIFLVKSFKTTFIDIWRFFSGHTVGNSNYVNGNVNYKNYVT